MACAYHIAHQLLSSHNATEIFELKQHIACLGSALHHAASGPPRCRQNVNSTDEAIGSDEIVAQVTRLLQRRSTKHHVCESLSPAKPSLPARLIEISPDPFHTDQYVVKLVVSRPSVQQYVCLSYRWNQSNLLCTTTTTLAQFADNIPWDKLSRTFKDAISVTYRLGICYLWIDSLCILRDSEEDKSCEVGKMSSIYANASLTLIASKSSSEDGTCCTHNSQEASRTFASSRKDADADIHVRQPFEHSNLDPPNPAIMSVPPLLNEQILPSQLVDTEDYKVDAGGSSHANLGFDQPYPPRAEFTNATKTGVSAINRVDIWLEETDTRDVEHLYPYARELLDDLLQEYIEGATEDVMQEGAQYDTPSDTCRLNRSRLLWAHRQSGTQALLLLRRTGRKREGEKVRVKLKDAVDRRKTTGSAATMKTNGQSQRREEVVLASHLKSD
jgi:hypothetical protein